MKLNRSVITTLVILLVLLAVAGSLTYKVYQNDQLQKSDASLVLGREQPDDFETINGDNVSMKDFEGQVRVVNSWASWSPFSKSELTDLNRLAADFADQDVAVIAINRNEQKERAQAYLRKLDQLDNLVILLDGDDSFYNRMDGASMPETLFFDKKGNIVHHARGKLSYEAMVEYVNLALNSN